MFVLPTFLSVRSQSWNNPSRALDYFQFASFCHLFHRFALIIGVDLLRWRISIAANFSARSGILDTTTRYPAFGILIINTGAAQIVFTNLCSGSAQAFANPFSTFHRQSALPPNALMKCCSSLWWQTCQGSCWVNFTLYPNHVSHKHASRNNRLRQFFDWTRLLRT